jgi:hypothetical protein
MAGTSTDDRAIFVWRGRDDGLNRLTDLIATKAADTLFTHAKTLHHLQDGKLVEVDLHSMRDIVNKHVRTLQLVNKGGRFEVEWLPLAFQQGADTEFEPDEKVLISLVEALAGRVARAGGRPTGVSLADRRSIRHRRQSGEPADRIAAAYGLSIETVRQIEMTG